MTEKPADTFGLEAGSLIEGRTADITIIDLEQEEEIDPTTFSLKEKTHHLRLEMPRLAGYDNRSVVKSLGKRRVH